VLSDDFPGSDPNEIWSTGATGGATVAETGGDAVITLPSGQSGGSDGSFSTNRYYNLLLDSVSVEVVSAGNTATTAQASFSISGVNDDYLEISQQNGTISFDQWISGAYLLRKSTTYSPTNHRYWRFREDGTNTYWETSGDGATWVTQTQAATTSLFPLDLVTVSLDGNTQGGEVSPGPVKFASVNGGGTPAGQWCAMSSITDDFQSSTQSYQWARSWVNSPETETQGGGLLVFTLAANAVKSGSYYSAASFDLTGSALLVQVPETANTATHAQTYINLDGPAQNQISMIEEDGSLFARITVDSTDQILGSFLYDSTEHAWWRIRESGGTLYWETAPDGKTWVVQQQLTPLPFAITALDVEIGSETYQATASPGASHFAACNLPPP
jgi:hypothetical protein